MQSLHLRMLMEKNLYKNDDIVTVGGLIGMTVLCNQHFASVFSA